MITGAALVARMEPPGPAFGRPDDKLRVIREQPRDVARSPDYGPKAELTPGYASLHPGYEC